MIRGMSRGLVVIFLLTVIFALAGPCYGQDRAALGFILDVLRRSHLSGSLVACGFPMTTKPIDSTAPPLQVFHEMFANDGEMQVTQEPDGTIRMMEKTVPQDLLKVKIAHISFDDEQKRNPNSMYFHKLVMDFITGAPEVKAFMKDQSILFAPKVINQAMSPISIFRGN